MTENLHPSQLHHYLQIYQRAKLASWGCLVASILLLSIGASLRGQALQYKPWVLSASVASLAIGSGQRKTVKQLATVLGDIELVSQLNFQFWVREKTKATAPMVINVPALTGDWQPDNLITDPVEYVNRVQKHVALVGGTGDGKSTQAQYFSTRIGGKVIVYDVDSGKGDWAWVEPVCLIGDSGLPEVNSAMSEALEHLEKMRVYRKEISKDVPLEFARFYIAEEFPVLADCDNAPDWIKQHAKVGRKRKQFIMVLAQNDTAANFALEGDADILDTCFVRIRLGKKAIDYARAALKNPQLEQWLKAGGKKRFMVDDLPCELDLSTWNSSAIATSPLTPPTATVESSKIEPLLPALNEYEQYIITWGQLHSGEVLKARTLQQSTRLFEGMAPEDIRILFAALADRGMGSVVGTGDRLGWMWVQPEE